MSYTTRQRIEIHLKARRKIGKLDKGDAMDKYVFMQQCMADLMDNGEADDDNDARDVCELMWEDGEGD